jgi:hypothetical protein
MGKLFEGAATSIVLEARRKENLNTVGCFQEKLFNGFT